ncbi:MAG: hypothetical protein A3G33_07525 [Omnitrophica bacterium RIFCSPLOWO2_12_FULL_44_17]|uniref:Uncharacterized protein n=1 Tax=Candidatus Danuiimicrobium aquiferis TaxID=1801832 RepID=A0A1G1KZL7_9BACT|nr:MAG: hypothetical protein A3B72_07825 [Omnitrophica bacterium RIFCSPHIGHO2_02_FULL_45_28]OGW92153.1 MAG: hypothetical protein A3E74_10315 [Omnitrophica bacterium RIFCSPHIGHO2_12_FULL_44_12]OGW98069.1 MAG: hypothetical protein A3G33_07525 [Omnitrophica bacterium RIFCSPLOWO2_12_FULL_44_17]OGX03489.1 MAG: hypothetical protein A3J12_02705 [Omnitrophica bacterium RIFCSPLOWO2_02_FULL_44_11]
MYGEPDFEPVDFRPFFRGIFKGIFIYPYRTAQKIAMWVEESRTFFLYSVWCPLLTCWLNVFWRDYDLSFFWFGTTVGFSWLGYFFICLFVAGLTFEKKKKKIMESKCWLDQNPDPSIVGINLVTGKGMETATYIDDDAFEVLGHEPFIRNFLLRLMDADVARNKAVIVIVPEGETNLIGEVNKILKDRKNPDEIKPLFYYSPECPELSASYSPFYRLNADCLHQWLFSLTEAEKDILTELRSILEMTDKPFDLEDYLVLLQNKKALLALGENRRLIHGNYFPHFDMLWKQRQALVVKLKQFTDVFGCDDNALTKAFPLDVEEIAKSRKKHLLIELPYEQHPMAMYLLYQLCHEIGVNYKYHSSENLALYLLYPDRLSDYFDNLELSNLAPKTALRIFTNQFYFAADRRDMQHTIFLPDFKVEKGILHEWEDGFFKRKMKEECDRLDQRIDFRSLLGEETVEAAIAIASELRLKTAAGFFNSKNETLVRRFYPPSTTPGQMEYEPLQKRYKAEDMLNLKELMSKVKYKSSDYDLGVAGIVQDLRPKGGSIRDKN